MTFELFTDVIVTSDLPAEDLKAGDVGTVVEHHRVSAIEDGYSAEFFDMTGSYRRGGDHSGMPTALLDSR